MYKNDKNFKLQLFILNLLIKIRLKANPDLYRTKTCLWQKVGGHNSSGQGIRKDKDRQVHQNALVMSI